MASCIAPYIIYGHLSHLTQTKHVSSADILWNKGKSWTIYEARLLGLEKFLEINQAALITACLHVIHNVLEKIHTCIYIYV